MSRLDELKTRTAHLRFVIQTRVEVVLKSDAGDVRYCRHKFSSTTLARRRRNGQYCQCRISTIACRVSDHIFKKLRPAIEMCAERRKRYNRLGFRVIYFYIHSGGGFAVSFT